MSSSPWALQITCHGAEGRKFKCHSIATEISEELWLMGVASKDNSLISRKGDVGYHENY